VLEAMTFGDRLMTFGDLLTTFGDRLMTFDDLFVTSGSNSDLMVTSSGEL